MVVLNHSVDGLVGFTIAMVFVSTASIVLRFWSRSVSPRVTFSWDDWLALAALVSASISWMDRS
jgi:hypothetical protein